MNDGKWHIGPHADDAATALRRHRDTAREELGRAVEELGHKLEVPARSKEKARGAVEATRHTASEAAHAVSDKAEQAKASAADLAHRVAAAAPEPVVARGRRTAGTVRGHPIAAALCAAGAAVLVWQIVRRL
ncbi:hypothetical protein OHA40_29200 [Nocardia sp. NBC_00508]|uniref:hypothetical protein n=1 Tax=Nocardia sp. NBC_00508 TaxID=2975992 RepID=UPI002E803060|nr:hypothetical protein [Nocardia sp. NBC_00508]WUD65652.1 hypothetical protein OHA40_29200 [Nocardia sp. NBC_00508]